MITVLWLLVLLGAVGAIVRGAKASAEHLGSAAERLSVSDRDDAPTTIVSSPGVFERMVGRPDDPH